MSALPDPGRAVPPELVERRPDPVDLLVRAHRVVLPGGLAAAAVAVVDGRIAAVLPVDVVVPARTEVLLCDDEVLLPGLVDTHVHLQDPGRDGWEGFASGTRAAVAGGVTTLVDMPLDGLPVTVDVDALRCKREAAEGRTHTDLAFWGGLVPTTTPEEVRGLHEAGVLGFKAYLCDSGLEQFPPLSPARLTALAREVAAVDGVLLVHAELATPSPGTQPQRHYADYLAAHPPTEELRAVEVALEVARETGARLHVVHASLAAVAERVAIARGEGLDVSAETCPHYLTLAAEDVDPGAAAAHLVCPPVRETLQREALWQALAHGSLGMVVSDHSPVPDADKQSDDLREVAPGISSLQLSLPLVWTAASDRGHTLADVVTWMASAPAALAGLDDRKGAVVVGRDADLVVFAPEEEFEVVPARLWHRQQITPYAGRRLRGVVRRTWLRGTPVDLTHPTGRLLEGRYPCASS